MTEFFSFLALDTYGGIDWLAVVTMVSSMYFLARQHRAGFIFGAVSSLCWIIFGTMVWSVADISANVLCFGLNVWGFWKWSSRNPALAKNEAPIFPTPADIGFLVSV